MDRQEAIKVIKDNWPESRHQLKEALQTLIPEFQENKGERIRKGIIEYLEQSQFGEEHYQIDDDIVRGYIAWLEKQGEPLCWIKCSDRLPNRDGIYLVVTDGSHNDVYDMAKYDSIEGWHKSSEVIYWMPIPQLNNKNIIEQKPAWSEEDKNTVKVLINIIKKSEMIDPLIYTDLLKEKLFNWLKSLKDKYTWKPSDEQIKGIKCAIKTLQYQLNVGDKRLDSLYDDLKKLREE